jgi:hypothetical protein
MWSSNFCVGESGERPGALYGFPNPLFAPPRDVRFVNLRSKNLRWLQNC